MLFLLRKSKFKKRKKINMTIDGFWHIEHSIGFHMKNQFTFGNWKACLCTEGAICMAYMVKCA